jgi:hypothetical protein
LFETTPGFLHHHDADDCCIARIMKNFAFMVCSPKIDLLCNPAIW